MKPSMSKTDAVAHVVDLVKVRHKMRQSEAEHDLQQHGFSRQEAITIVGNALRKKLVRSTGSALRPPEISKSPHLEQDYMTGWWGMYVGGEYKGQRPTHAEAERALRDLTSTDPFAEFDK